MVRWWVDIFGAFGLASGCVDFILNGISIGLRG